MASPTLTLAAFATTGAVAATRTDLGAGQEAVVIGVQTGEGFGRAGRGVGDRNGAAIGRPLGALSTTLAPTGMASHSLTAAMMTAIAPTGAGALSALRPGGVELGAADRAVLVGVQSVETGGRAVGVTGLLASANFLGGQRSVVVRVERRQTRGAGLDELGLADLAIAIGVEPRVPRAVRLSRYGRHGGLGRRRSGQKGCDRQGDQARKSIRLHSIISVGSAIRTAPLEGSTKVS